MLLFKTAVDQATCTGRSKISLSLIKITFLLCLWVVQPEASAQANLKEQPSRTDPLKLSYIGNMGVLFSSAGDAVIIDGLHKKYKPAYLHPSETTVQQIIKGTYQEYGPVSMVLFTHHHLDHFDSDYALAFLRAEPKSLVLAASQSTEKIREKSRLKATHLLQQLQQIPYDDATHTIRNGQVEVTAFKCPHVNARHAAVQNLAFLVHINGYKVLHVGDSHWDVAALALQRAKLTTLSIDIAILPYWMLLDKNSKEKVDQLIRPKKLIATHIPPKLGQREHALLHQNHNNIIVFDKLNQQITYQ